MAQTNVGRVVIGVSANPAGVVTGLATAKSALVQFEVQVRGIADRVKGYFAGFLAFQGAKFLVGTAAGIEASRVALQGLIGDVQRGSDLFNQLRSFQQQSPFSLDEVTDAAKRLLGFGIAAENVLPILRQLADVSQGQSESFSLLALVYGQIQSAGRLLGQDANQLSTHFSILGQLSKMTGIKVGELRKAMQDGAITTEMVTAAFKAATSAGGTFNNAMGNFMGTAAGKFRQLWVEVTKTAEVLGQALLPAITKVAALFMMFLKAIQNIGSAKMTLIVKTVAFIGVLYLMVRAVVVVQQTIGLLTRGYQALAKAQIISQALSGPKGWMALAGAAAIAATAFLLVDEVFGEFEAATASISAEARAAQDEFRAILAPLEKYRNAAGAAKDATDGMADSAEKLKDSLASRGEQLRQSLRTPIEVFRDSVREMLTLLQNESIDLETFRRAYLQARETFLKNQPKPAQVRIDAGIGAARQGTTEGFSAVQAAIRAGQAADRQRELQKQQLAEQREANKILREQLRTMRMGREPLDALGID